jgi:hypothetical protein
MKVDLVFTGLCSFLNVDGHNSTMGDPAVIAVQSPMQGMPGMASHVAFIAYDTTITAVDDDTGFITITKAPECKYLEIPDGVEISIVNHPAVIVPVIPTVDQTYYNSVVRKDDYWPEAKDQWNRDYVPAAGNKPKSTAVKFYMRFGSGALSAGRVSDVKWRFKRPYGSGYFEGNFAEEVVYGFSQTDSEVVVEFRSLDHPENAAPVKSLRFSPIQTDVTIFIGNNVESDFANAVRRTVVVKATKQNDHFKHLNAIAGLGDGIIPIAINPPGTGGGGGGGENGGPCGPMSGNN